MRFRLQFNSHATQLREAASRTLRKCTAEADLPDRKPALKRWTEVALLGLFVIAFSVVASKVPPSGDDWTWGSSIGTGRLTNDFTSYNGRYAGNLLVIFMTRLGWVTPIIQGLGLAVIIGLVLDITRNRTIAGYATLSSLLFLMPAPLWAESVVWVPGYANFAVASIAILVFFRSSMGELVDNQGARPSRIGLAVIFMFAVASQFLAEHVTVYLLLASLAILAVLRIAHGHFNLRLLSWAGGFAIGAMMMFASPEYRRIASGSGESYKEMGSQGGSLAKQVTAALRNQVATNGLLSNRVAILAIALLVAIIATTKLVTSDRSTGTTLPLLAAAATGIAVTLTMATKVTLEPLEVGSSRTVLAMVTVIILIMLATLLLTETLDRVIVAVSVASMAALNAPLLLVRPVSARTFLPTFILLLIVVSVFLASFRVISDPRVVATWFFLAFVTGLTGWLHLYGVYSDIDQAADTRIALLKNQVASGTTVVSLKRLPHTEWMKRPDPDTPYWIEAFKVYYDLPQDLSISLTD